MSAKKERAKIRAEWRDDLAQSSPVPPRRGTATATAAKPTKKPRPKASTTVPGLDVRHGADRLTAIGDDAADRHGAFVDAAIRHGWIKAEK